MGSAFKSEKFLAKQQLQKTWGKRWMGMTKGEDNHIPGEGEKATRRQISPIPIFLIFDQ